jgi:hypothetical protein
MKTALVPTVFFYYSYNDLKTLLMHFFYVHVTVHRNKFLCNKTN